MQVIILVPKTAKYVRTSTLLCNPHFLYLVYLSWILLIHYSTILLAYISINCEISCIAKNHCFFFSNGKVFHIWLALTWVHLGIWVPTSVIYISFLNGLYPEIHNYNNNSKVLRQSFFNGIISCRIYADTQHDVANFILVITALLYTWFVVIITSVS